MEAVKSYDTRVDAKGRITLRGATYTNYNVRMFENGCFLIEPRELTVPEGISAKSLEEMDAAVANFEAGNVSDAVDLSDFD